MPPRQASTPLSPDTVEPHPSRGRARSRRPLLIALAAKVDEVQAQIVRAESSLKADQVQLGYTRIYAPMAGTIVSVDARQGQTINAAYSTPVLMRVADLATMTVWTQVSEADIPQLHSGMPLYFTTLGFGDRRWEGTLRQILPAPPKPDNTTEPAVRRQRLHGIVRYRESQGRTAPRDTAQVFSSRPPSKTCRRCR